MGKDETTLDILLEAYDDGCQRCARDLRAFTEPLYAWCDQLVKPDGLPADWRGQLDVYLAEQVFNGYRVLPEHLPPLLEWIQTLEEYRRRQEARKGPVAQLAEAQANDSERSGPTIFLKLPPGYPTREQIAAAKARDAFVREQRRAMYEERNRQVLEARRAAGEARAARGRNKAAGVNSDDYIAETQEWIRVLGPDWKNVSFAAIRQLRAARELVLQSTGGLGTGANALGVEAFVRLRRKDGGVDTAHFRFVWPWFNPPHWELVRVIRVAAPEQEAAALAARERIRHADVMRVRGAINRFQAGMFAIIGGVGGIVEGAPLLGTIGAAGGVEEAALAGADLATGRTHRAWSAQAVQAALESAGLDTETAKFLAEHGGLLTALSRATVDAAGTAHAVIETSSGYRIRLKFDKATLSASGLGSAKIKVTRLAPDGTKIKPIGSRYPINSSYAGRVMPASALPKALRAKYPNGVRFTSEGFPDFSPYSKRTLPVKGLTGNRRTDAIKANHEAGYAETPDGYIWHHHQDGVTMQLVPRDLHVAVGHTGGVAVIHHGTK